jgi:hypothetical protein
VNGRGAFDGEMGFPRRLSEEQQERLLAGAPSADGGELDQTAAFVRALPALVREQPDEVLAAALVPRLAAAARGGAAEAAEHPTAPLTRRPTRSRRMLVARVAVAVALLPALMAGLAFAGVSLPQPAQDALDRVGVDLPNQSAVDEEEDTTGGDADDGDAGQPADKGSETAKEKRRQGTKKSNPARAQGRGHGAQGQGRALGKRGLAPGQTGAAGNIGKGGGQGKGKSTGSSSAGGGKAKEPAKSGPKPPKQQAIPPGQAKAKTKAEGKGK